MRRLDDAVLHPEERLRTSGEAVRRPSRLDSRRGRRMAALALAGIGCAGLLAGGGWLVLSGRAESMAAEAGRAVVAATANAGLAVHDIRIEGNARTPREKVLAALGLRLGEPMLGFDLKAARERVETLPWVAGARIERQLPGVVKVAVREREAIAIWQRQGRHVLVDAAGESIAVDVRPFGHLPVLVGDDAPDHAGELMAVLARAPELKARVRAAVRLGARRWDVVLDDVDAGITVRLPETGADAAWQRLAALEAERALLTPRVAVVDLRLPDRLVLRRRDGETAQQSAAGVGA